MCSAEQSQYQNIEIIYIGWHVNYQNGLPFVLLLWSHQNRTNVQIHQRLLRYTSPCRRWPIPFWNFPNEMGTECWMNCCQQFINLCSCFVCWVQDFPNFVCWRVKRLKIYTILLFTFSKHPNRMPFHMYSRKTYSNDCTMYIRYKWAQNAARKTMIDHIA